MARLGLPQEKLAALIGIHPTLLSRYFRGLRKPPPDFEAKVNAALDRLEAAERAAEEARQRVLAGGAA